jgi:hypothetical protein
MPIEKDLDGQTQAQGNQSQGDGRTNLPGCGLRVRGGFDRAHSHSVLFLSDLKRMVSPIPAEEGSREALDK